MLRAALLLGLASGASAVCNASALPYTATTYNANAAAEAFAEAVTFVNATYNTNNVPIVNIQGALVDATQGFQWMSINLPTHLYAAQADGRYSCLVDSLRLIYAQDTTLYQVLWATNSLLQNPVLTSLDPGLPSVLATYLGRTAGTPAIADAAFMALIYQADALETFTTKFATAAPTASVGAIQVAVQTILAADLVAVATAMTPGLLLAAAGDTLGAVQAFYTVYAATPEYYRILWNFTPLSAAVTGSAAIPDLSLLLPAQLDPGYPTALAAAMGVAAPVDISTAFEQVIWVLTLTQHYYTDACCPWPMVQASAECLAALESCTISATAIQNAIQDATEGTGVLVPAAVAMTDGLVKAAAGDTIGLVMHSAAVYRDTPIYCAPRPTPPRGRPSSAGSGLQRASPLSPARPPARPLAHARADKIIYAYTPIPAAVAGTAIPGLAGLLPSLNPGLPTPLAVAMGLPQNATPIHHYCEEQTECIYGGGIRQVCANGKGQHECQCTFSYQHEYPFCTEPTSQTDIAVGCYCFYIICYTTVFFAFVYVCAKRARTAKMEVKCLFSFFSTTILWGLIGSGCILAKYCYNLHEVLAPFEHPKAYLDQRTDGVLLTICGIFLPLCTNNVSMMWIEFALASKRMASMSANLKLTKNIIFCYCAFYMVAGTVFLYITVGPPEDPPDPIDTDFEYVTRGLLALNSLLTSVTYFYGGRSMYFIFARHAEQEKTAMNNTCKTQTATTSTDQADGGEGGGASYDEDEQMKAQEEAEAKARSEATLRALQVMIPLPSGAYAPSLRVLIPHPSFRCRRARA